MAKWLAAAAVLVPVVFAAAVGQRVAGETSTAVAVVYLTGSRVCHQRPDRSFQTAGVQWPVCARCSGLYLGAAAGSLLTLGVLAGRRRERQPARWLIGASLPTALTIAVEWSGVAPVSNLVRSVAALPAGAAVARAIILAVSERRAKAIG